MTGKRFVTQVADGHALYEVVDEGVCTSLADPTLPLVKVQAVDTKNEPDGSFFYPTGTFGQGCWVSKDLIQEKVEHFERYWQ